MERLSTPPAISALASQFDGAILTPDHPDYERAHTLFYGGMTRRPAAIARAANVGDVARVITFARENRLELAVRGGGHSIAGHSATEGGILLDLSAMRGLEIDVEGRSAWAEAGITAGEYTEAAGAHGLATGFGDTGSVGIGGITLGGGIGFLVRKHGLTIDALLGADIVTADGELLRVNEENHPDLFWAIRGGGGNFGVVTRFHFRLYEVGDIYGGLLFLPATPDTIAGFIAAADAAPDELTSILTAMGPSENPFLPPEMHNKKLLMAHIVYGGDPEAGARAVAPFRALAQPLMDTLAPMPYAHLYHEEAGEGGEGEYHPTAASRTLFIDYVDHTVATTILDALNESNVMMRMCQLRVLGGAVGRVPADATAFAHRHRRIMVVLAAMYAQPEAAAMQEDWCARLATALRQGEESAYVNFIGREETDLSRAAYPGATWERLRAVKRLYDPANLFRRNHNIPPAD